MKTAIRASAIAILLVFLLLSSVPVFAADTPTITVGSALGRVGEIVRIPVSIENNSGIIALYCSLRYDSAQLRLVKVTNGSTLTDPAHSGRLETNPYRLCFDMSLANKNKTDNGVIATLDFEILSTAKAGDTEISISYNPEEIYDYNLKNVYFEPFNGKIQIVSKNADDAAQPDPNATGQPSTGADDTMDISIEPSEKAPWDKVLIQGGNLQDKNITTEQTNEGLVIRGDHLSGVTAKIQKGGKTVSVKIDTAQQAVLLKENENGEVEAYIASDGDDGVFKTPIMKASPFKNTAAKPFPTALKILIPTVSIVVIAGFVAFFVKKKTKSVR